MAEARLGGEGVLMIDTNRLKETTGVIVFGLGLATISFFLVHYAALTTPGAYLRFDLALFLFTLINCAISCIMYTIKGISVKSISVLVIVNFIMVTTSVLIVKGVM